MTTQPQKSSILGVDLKVNHNNVMHHTGEISKELLVLRRGQSFSMSIQFNHPFIEGLHALTFTVQTGEMPEEDRGTKSVFGIPDSVKRSVKAKAVWKAELDRANSYLKMGTVALTITPPASTPVGKYTVHLTHTGEESELAPLVVLFNPWCTDDWVYISEETERQEYVMNQHGVIFKGSGNYINSMDWDYGQFESKMAQICFMILDLNLKHLKDPADDVSARCNPIYVSRVISAMINSEDDRGVLVGQWSGNFFGGVPPSRWSGSYPILERWLSNFCQPVRYGQCWVFAAVMCSVLRFLGIPSRVVTNYQSAHDSNCNLIIDVYHADYGVREIPSEDSVWNFHVWVECWMKRPDLPPGYDGWQVLDPTPQERSEGVYCCGPAPVQAIFKGDVDLKYSVPFVFAEVNADCIDWLVKADGSMVEIYSDTKRVGQNISTKSVGSDKRWNITDNYKHREGTEAERAVFKYALARDYSSHHETEDSESETEGTTTDEQPQGDRRTDEPSTEGETNAPVNGPSVNGPSENESSVNGPSENESSLNKPSVNGTPLTRSEENSNHITEVVNVETRSRSIPVPQVTLKFEEVSKPENGKDVKVNLVLHSEATVSTPLSISISVQAMSYKGSPMGTIQTDLQELSLQPGADLRVPVVVLFSQYWEPMLDSDVMKISAVVTDKNSPTQVYLAESDVVLLDPPVDIKLLNEARVWRDVILEVSFLNPVSEILKNCTLTVSGSGLLKKDETISLPDLHPNNRVRVQMYVFPYKTGLQTVMVDFDCSVFRDIKGSTTIHVKDSIYRY